MLEVGTHKVRVVGCFSGESAEKKTPFAGIEFETIKEEESINWIGYLTDTIYMKDKKETTPTKEAFKTLYEIGFAGRAVSDLSDNTKKISDLFREVDNISIVVEHEEFTNEKGNTSVKAKVKYVNVGTGLAKFDHEQAVIKFKSLGLDGVLLQIRKEMGIKETVVKQEPTSNNLNFAADEIPF